VYFLVLIHDPSDGPAGTVPEHEPFIDSLIRRNAVLLGGHFPQSLQPGVRAAYLLRCETLSEARAIAAEDPAATAGRVSVWPWELVAINTAAIDEQLIVTPEDIPGT
jgi:hypothetical protein